MIDVHPGEGGQTASLASYWSARSQSSGAWSFGSPSAASAPLFFLCVCVCVTSRLIITDTWSRWMESAANNFGDWSVICWDDRSERERPLFFFDVGCSTIDSLFNQICGRSAFNKRNVVNCILEGVNFEKCYLCRESFDYCLHGAVWKFIILTNYSKIFKFFRVAVNEILIKV